MWDLYKGKKHLPWLENVKNELVIAFDTQTILEKITKTYSE